MSISQTTPKETASDHLFCPQCHVALPDGATFCSSCGERLERKKHIPVADEEDITNRYRITTLVRRRPYINLYFALDNRQSLPAGQPRVVAIRDIEITDLKEEASAEALSLAQQEYDQLRHWHIPHLLTSIDQRVSQGHLFLISGMPLDSQTSNPNTAHTQRLYTLQDFLQSGQGLPKEARALEWIRNICQAVEGLHSQKIILGDLDPYTVVLNKNSGTADPALMISWLRPEIQRLLPAKAALPQISYFSAPEAIQGRPEISSDVYSLGALLYLLLTGTPPDESTLRNRRRLRTPHEVNSRISQHVDDCVMQALALEPGERFASVKALMEALDDPHFRRTPRKPASPSGQLPEVPPGEAETVRIVPLSQKDVARWRTAREEKHDREKTASQSTQRMPVLEKTLPPASTPFPPIAPRPTRNTRPVREKLGTLPTTPVPGDTSPERSSSPDPRKTTAEQDTLHTVASTPKPAWKDRITGMLPAILPDQHKQKTRSGKAGQKAAKNKPLPQTAQREDNSSLLKQLQQLILGHQRKAIKAAAIIETPMRIRPDQPYNLRLHIMGRDDLAVLQPQGSKKTVQQGGLSAMIHGEVVQVEVRSVLQQGYTYILQCATVTVPANGYAAEITIPMQPQPGGTGGRRDRLHFFFLDGRRNPLYEKPFIVEVFVSPLVQFGREGHQVLTIPI